MARLLPLVVTHPEPPINAPLHTPNAAEAPAAAAEEEPEEEAGGFEGLGSLFG